MYHKFSLASAMTVRVVTVLFMVQVTRPNHWNHAVSATFKRVIAWDMLFFVLGMGGGAGIGAFLTTL